MVQPIYAQYAGIALTLLLFALLPAPRALCFAFIGGTLLLPELAAMRFSGFPEIGKYQIISLSCLAGGLFFRPAALNPARMIRGPELIALLAIPALFGTVRANRDAFALYPGMRTWDLVSLSFTDLVYHGIPFILGRAYLRRATHLRFLIVTLLGATLLYSLGVLFEARMSPQLHRILYGYSQHSFLQVARGGGWRPMVLMPHGLAVGLFMCCGLVIAVGASRWGQRVRGLPARWAAYYLFAIAFLTRSLGAQIISLPLALATRYLRARTIFVIALVIIGYFLVFPMLRAAEWVPTQEIVDAARKISTERADSLDFRFYQENRLLDHARERWWFGWGGYGRNQAVRIDPERMVVVDGYWIVRLSSRGFFGFLAYALLFAVPVFQAWRTGRRLPPGPEQWWLATGALVLSMYALDTIPNGLFLTLPLLIAGSVSGAATELARYRPQAAAVAAAPPGAAPPAAVPRSSPLSGLLSRPGRRAR